MEGVSMSDKTYETKYLDDVLPRLSDYLLQDDLFWPVNTFATPPYPKLTLGNALLFLMRLQAKDAEAAQDYVAKLDALRNEWKSHWEEKAVEEYKSRLQHWRQYLDELIKEPQTHAAYYHTEVRLRTLLSILHDEVKQSDLPPEAELLSALDSRLKAHVVSGDFVWGEDYAAVFSQGEYWYLYARPRV